MLCSDGKNGDGMVKNAANLTFSSLCARLVEASPGSLSHRNFALADLEIVRDVVKLLCALENLLKEAHVSD